MAKRIGVSVLWYLAVGWGLNFLAFFFGFPSLAVYGIAFGTAAFVGIDPLHLFWLQPSRPTEFPKVASTPDSSTLERAA